MVTLSGFQTNKSGRKYGVVKSIIYTVDSVAKHKSHTALIAIYQKEPDRLNYDECTSGSHDIPPNQP
jgi:hypothetical protein